MAPELITSVGILKSENAYISLVFLPAAFTKAVTVKVNTCVAVIVLWPVVITDFVCLKGNVTATEAESTFSCKAIVVMMVAPGVLSNPLTLIKACAVKVIADSCVRGFAS